MPKLKTKEEFVKDAISVHGLKYDYSKVDYVNNHSKVCIICPEHGEFWMTPNSHLSGQGCPKCGIKHRVEKSKTTLNEFIEKAKKLHGDKYDYSKVEYVNCQTKICIICPEHGEFWQTPDAHLRGCNCPKCTHRSYSYTREEFIEKVREVHGDKYDYSKVKYVNNKTKVCIICPEHGEFLMTPNSHLSGQGCPKCGIEKRGEKIAHTLESFIEKAREVHGDKYDYSECTNYVNNRTKVKIICHKKNVNNKEHGEFWQTPHGHLGGYGCPKCGNTISLAEDEIYSFIKDELKFMDVEKRNLKVGQGTEVDIYIPSLKIGIEYNGLIWHSEKFGKDKHYHLNKTEKFIKNGISLMHIFEDEYLEHKEIVLSKIRNILGCNTSRKVYARKCIVKEIKQNGCRKFLNDNHIQSFTPSTIYLGCYCEDKLIGVMSFRKEIKNSNNWELTRFATDINYHCIGVGGKLFKYFIKNYNPDKVKSFADRRWTIDKDDNLYTKLGFRLTKILPPDYRYVKGIQRLHKFNCRKDKLMKKYPNSGLTSDMTEKEMCDKLGFYRIWDCGLYKFEWFNPLIFTENVEKLVKTPLENVIFHKN